MGETGAKACISIFSWDKKKAPDNNNNDGNGTPQKKGMRRSSSVGIFKAALGMLRTKSMSQLAEPDESSTESPFTPFPPSLETVPGDEQKAEAAAAPSTSPPVGVLAVSAGDTSRDDSPRKGMAKEKCRHRKDEEGGDEKIDTKAEEFIAQFYEQMKLQSMNS